MIRMDYGFLEFIYCSKYMLINDYTLIA